MKSLRRKETQFIHYIHLRKYRSLFCCRDSRLLFICLFTSESHGGLKLSWLSRSIAVRQGPRPLGHWSVGGWGLPQGDGFPRERQLHSAENSAWERLSCEAPAGSFSGGWGMRAFILKAQLRHTTYFRVVRAEWDISWKTASIVSGTLEMLIKWQLLCYQLISIECLPINKEGT